MSRIGLVLIVLCMTGCRGTGPWNFAGPTRVPPPPTGAVGNTDYGAGYYEPAPRPDLGQGASVAPWPANNWSNDPESLSNQDAFGSRPATALPPTASVGTGTLDPTQQASWVDPLEAESGLRPSSGPGQPLVSAPPRIQFQSTPDRRTLSVPQELAYLRNPMLPSGDQVRQASRYSNWQPHYDDVRR